eukprot:COSAG02_NODE_373_length_23594_cov_6.892190_7_plen_59_part_00
MHWRRATRSRCTYVYVRVHTTCTKACALHSLLLALRTALRAIDAPSKFLRAAAPFAYA